MHGQDLQALRNDSQATIEQLRAAHNSTIESLKAEHQEALEGEVRTLEKQIAKQNVELKATQEDLTKAKLSLAAATQDMQKMKMELDEARQIAAASDQTDKDEVITRLMKELSNIRDDHASLNDMFTATKGSLIEITKNHTTELEEAAKGRAEEVMKLRSEHQEEVAVLTKDKSGLLTRLSDLEGELVTAKAALAAAADRALSPKSNGSAHARTASVTPEDLQKLHEAHNLKLRDVQAEHEKAMRMMTQELEITHAKTDELQQEVARKAMEIQYLEQEQDENQDQITRYVRVFGLKSFIGAMVALGVIYGIFL